MNLILFKIICCHETQPRFSQPLLLALGRHTPTNTQLIATGEPPWLELKYDFGADSFNMQDFWATETALNTVMLAYNLMSLFRRVLLKTVVVKKGASQSIEHTLKTLRYKLFARPAYTTTESRKPILNLALGIQKRQWMQGLWDQAKQFDLPVKFTASHSP